MDWTTFLERETAAVLSPDGVYRYWLHRSWHRGKGWCVFVMLNPSTADHKTNDPTIRRCISFAQTWGYKGIVVVNLYAARATNPVELLEMDDPEGPQNELYIRRAINLVYESQRGVVVCAWGGHKMARRRSEAMRKMIKQSGVQPRCLRMTRHGYPEHPLYIPSDQDLVHYNGR